jgi:hypothetical protein
VTKPQRPRLRLQCECGRNLADALEPAGSSWVRVFPRPGVDQEIWQPGAFRATCRWRCKCGRVPEVRVDRIARVYLKRLGWQRYGRRVVTVIVGTDV